jgi:quinol monooxygenase YgiN
MTAQVAIRPELAEKCEQAIREFIQYIEENEPDTNFYFSMRDSGNATNYLHVFSFKDESGREKHRNSPAVRRFTDTLYPELVSEGVEFKEYTLVSTTGT